MLASAWRCAYLYNNAEAAADIWKIQGVVQGSSLQTDLDLDLKSGHATSIAMQLICHTPGM